MQRLQSQTKHQPRSLQPTSSARNLTRQQRALPRHESIAQNIPCLRCCRRPRVPALARAAAAALARPAPEELKDFITSEHSGQVSAEAALKLPVCRLFEAQRGLCDADFLSDLCNDCGVHVRGGAAGQLPAGVEKSEQ